MADIPNDRNTVFPTWAAIKENLATGVAKIESPTVGRASVAAQNIAGVPSNIGSPTMDLIYLNLPVDLWATHNSVNMNGNEYPEVVNTSVPAGKSLTINGGQRWLETSVQNAAPTFQKELPDDLFFVNLASGATLTLNADKTNGTAITAGMKDPNAPLVDKDKFQQFALGGKNVAVVSGSGTFNADMGAYANNLFVTAAVANVKMGEGNGVDGRGYYGATGDSQGHDVTGGKKADTFEYNFEGQNRTIGTNKFNGKSGSTDVGDTDAIQLRNLPVGSKVEVKVNAINGGGVFPDADMSIKIKKPDGTELGTIDAKDVNYLFLLNNSNQFVSPKDIGAGGNRNYTIGQ